MNQDPNDPRKPVGGLGGKDVWNTPEGDVTCASSIQTGQESPDDDNDDESAGNNQVISYDERRDTLQRQMMQWGIASGTSITAVTVAFVPAQIIMAFFITVSLFLGFSFTIFQRLRLEALELQRQGVTGYLPEAMVESLTQTSFHDWIVNGTFWEENGFFLLYFIPGLSEEQLNRYVNRLIPRSQNVLRRQGIGHFLGPSFMSLLLGEERYAEEMERQEQPQDEGRPVPRRLELTAADEASHLGPDDEATHATETPGSDFSRFWAATPPVTRVFAWAEEPSVGSSASLQERSANIPLQSRGIASATNPSNDGTDDEEEDELAIDAQVLRDAISGGIGSITDGMYEAVSNTTVSFFTGTPLRTGMTATAAAVGIGYLGMWLGGGVPSGDRMRMPRSSMPSNPVIYSSFLASGATASIMYLFPQIGRSAGGPGGGPSSGDSSPGRP